MHTITLDMEHGSASIDSKPIKIDEHGVLVGSIGNLCAPPTLTNQGRTRYRLSKKVNFCGQSADGIIEVEDGKIFSLTFLFDFIEFFESSVLESKILKSCARLLNADFKSTHPSTAFSYYEWGQATFLYDPKQGDLSLKITFQRG